jgi:PAS domain-containing protein
MSIPERRIDDTLGSALHRLATLERTVGAADGRVSGERIAGDLRRVVNDIERASVETRDAARSREMLRQVGDAASRRAKLLFVLSPIPSFVLDRAGTIVEANPAAAHLVNTSLRHLTGRAFDLFVSAERQKFLLQLTSIEASSDVAAQWPITIRPRERGSRRVMFTVVAENQDLLLALLLPAEDDQSFSLVRPGNNREPALSEPSAGGAS